jgi:hypothetical protein
MRESEKNAVNMDEKKDSSMTIQTNSDWAKKKRDER